MCQSFLRTRSIFWPDFRCDARFHAVGYQNQNSVGSTTFVLLSGVGLDGDLERAFESGQGVVLIIKPPPARFEAGPQKGA